MVATEWPPRTPPFKATVVGTPSLSIVDLYEFCADEFDRERRLDGLNV